METVAKIAVASENTLKVAAVKAAFEHIFKRVHITGFSTNSGVPEQPIGYETLLGCRNRLHNLSELVPPGYWLVAIENGIFTYANWLHIDRAIVLVQSPDGSVHKARSDGVRLPHKYYVEARTQGFGKITVGSIVAKHIGCDPKDPQKQLTKGRKPRELLISQAVLRALKKHR